MNNTFQSCTEICRKLFLPSFFVVRATDFVSTGRIKIFHQRQHRSIAMTNAEMCDQSCRKVPLIKRGLLSRAEPSRVKPSRTRQEEKDRDGTETSSEPARIFAPRNYFDRPRFLNYRDRNGPRAIAPAPPPPPSPSTSVDNHCCEGVAR